MQLRPTYPLRTARLDFRPVTVEDIDEMLTYRSREDVCRYLPFEPMTHEVLRERIETGTMRFSEFTGEGQAVTWAVRLIETEQLIGDVVLFFHSAEHRSGEVGYGFHPDVAGNGYATEAAALMLALGFEQLGLHRIVARLDARNTPSARVAERLGMRREAHLLENEWFKGEWADELVYAMLETEWPTSAAHSLHAG